MAHQKAEKRVARVFSDIGGYHVCSDDLPYLDTRGPAYDTKAAALRAATEAGYTHAIGGGTYWDGVRAIPRNGGTI